MGLSPPFSTIESNSYIFYPKEDYLKHIKNSKKQEEMREINDSLTLICDGSFIFLKTFGRIFKRKQNSVHLHRRYY